MVSKIILDPETVRKDTIQVTGQLKLISAITDAIAAAVAIPVDDTDGSASE